LTCFIKVAETVAACHATRQPQPQSFLCLEAIKSRTNAQVFEFPTRIKLRAQFRILWAHFLLWIKGSKELRHQTLWYGAS